MDYEQFQEFMDQWIAENGGRYTSAHSGVAIDAAVSAVRAKETVWDARIIPPGGLRGQALVKKSDADFDVEWSYSVAPPTPIYGVTWDGSASPLWSRTDDAALFADPVAALANGTGSSPFDDLMPWAGMRRVSDPVAGELVEIPKYWYKWERSGAAMRLRIAAGPVEGYHVSPAHADRGDGKGERDLVYVGRYHCNAIYKSAAGSVPKTSITRATARTAIHALGDTIWQYDFAMYWTIMMLYLVEYASWDSQKMIGFGCSAEGKVFNLGATDGMGYHTGTTAATRDGEGSTQYRHIEGLWDNVFDWRDGIYFNAADIYCIKNPAEFSDTAGGTLTGARPTSAGYISAFANPTEEGFEYALYPSAVAGSADSYVCDYCYYDASGVVLHGGGNYSKSRFRGLFYLNGNNPASYSDADTGCRLQKLP